MMSVMVISSLYFVEQLCQYRILPLTAHFASFRFGLAIVPLALSLGPSVAGLVASLFDLAFGLADDLCLSPFVHDTPLSLLAQDLLDVTDFFLHFAGYLFIGTFSFQPRIIGDFPGDLFDLTLHFVKRSLRLVSRARFHGIPPLGFLPLLRP